MKKLLIIPLLLLTGCGNKNEDLTSLKEIKNYEANYELKMDLNGNKDDYIINLDYNETDTHIKVTNTTEYFTKEENQYIDTATLSGYKDDSYMFNEETFDVIPYLFDFSIVKDYSDGTYTYEITKEQFLKLIPESLNYINIDNVNLNVTVKDGYVESANATSKYNIAGHQGDLTLNINFTNYNTNSDVANVSEKVGIIDTAEDLVRTIEMDCMHSEEETDPEFKINCGNIDNEFLSDYNSDATVHNVMNYTDGTLNGSLKIKDYIVHIDFGMINPKIEKAN